MVEGRGGLLGRHQALPDYHVNMAMAGFGPLPPELMEARAAARGDQEATNRLYMVGEGLVSP